MAKKDRFPDPYSGGFPHNDESEGSGCSGRDHMETSGYDNSSGNRQKWIKLSSAFHDGFGVPIRRVPFSTLPSSEKQKWLLRLRSELDQIRTFQKKVDMDKAHATMSSSTSNKVQGNQNQTNLRKPMDPQQAQKSRAINPGAKRLQSVNEPALPDTFSLILRKQCENLLKKLMTHQHGWVFNKPVDVVALKIPDYFNVIKKPMDLGTVKEKLASCKYSTPLQFAADVRLTFLNAMTYNPPGNDVHIMADIVSKFFELRWKPIEKRLPVISSQQQPPPPVHEVIDIVKPMPPSKKRKVTSIQQNLLSEPVKPVMTNDEKVDLSRELETYLGDLPDNIIDFLRKHGSNGGEGGEDEIEIDIDALNDDSLFELRKMLDDHVKSKQNHSKAEPCVIELLNESGLSNSTMQLYKGNDVADEDLDAGGNEAPVSSKNNDKQTTAIGTSSDSNSSSASENALKHVKASSSFSGAKEQEDKDGGGMDLEHKADINHATENRSDGEENSQQKRNCNESDSQKDDGGGDNDNERQVSPDKLYRAALLKNRFADTIFKAREKTLTQDEKADPEKLRREKEQLENHKRKEKARLAAEAKAAEDARRRVEAEAAAQAKKKRDLEREAARQALLKIEKTVEIDEASRFLKDLEMLRAADPTDPTSLDINNNNEISPEQEHESSQDVGGLGSFNFGGSNALEQLGLYMKRDDDDEHEEANEEEETELEPVTFLGDVEEGEIN